MSSERRHYNLVIVGETEEYICKRCQETFAIDCDFGAVNFCPNCGAERPLVQTVEEDEIEEYGL